jgi:hypothetical protein
MGTATTMEARRLHVWALAQALKSHGYAVTMAESEPLVMVLAAFGPLVRVRCDHRAARPTRAGVIIPISRPRF